MKKIFLIFAIVLVHLGYSQTSDFQIWSKIKLQYNIKKKSAVNLKQSLRTFQNSTYWKTIFTEIAYSYKINKNVKTAIGYRFSTVNKIEYTYNKHRLFIDLILLKRINSIKLKFKPRFQIDKEIHNCAIYSNRELLEISKKINKIFSFYLSTEVYFTIPSKAIERNFSGFNKYRFTGGTIISINKKNNFEVFYRYQHEKYSTISNAYILGITYKYLINE